MCTTNFISTCIIRRRNKCNRLEVLRLFIVLVSEHINFSQFMMQSVTMGIFYFRQAFSRFARYFISFYSFRSQRMKKNIFKFKCLSLILSSLEMNLIIYGWELAIQKDFGIGNSKKEKRELIWWFSVRSDENSSHFFVINFNQKNSIFKFVISIKQVPEYLDLPRDFWTGLAFPWLEQKLMILMVIITTNDSSGIPSPFYRTNLNEKQCNHESWIMNPYKIVRSVADNWITIQSWHFNGFNLFIHFGIHFDCEFRIAYKFKQYFRTSLYVFVCFWCINSIIKIISAIYRVVFSISIKSQ